MRLQGSYVFLALTHWYMMALVYTYSQICIFKDKDLIIKMHIMNMFQQLNQNDKKTCR